VGSLVRYCRRYLIRLYQTLRTGNITPRNTLVVLNDFEVKLIVVLVDCHVKAPLQVQTVHVKLGLNEVLVVGPHYTLIDQLLEAGVVMCFALDEVRFCLWDFHNPTHGHPVTTPTPVPMGEYYPKLFTVLIHTPNSGTELA
jgi:hypothetical protein